MANTYVNIKTDNVDKNVPTKETMDTLLATKAAKSHNHNSLYYKKAEVDTLLVDREANFKIYANNEMNFCTGYANTNGRGDVYFNVSGATAPISTYGLMDGMGHILGNIIHNNNLETYWLNTFRLKNIGVTSIELNAENTTSTNGGYIDFHFKGTTSDYTSRIIEASSGILDITKARVLDPGVGSAVGGMLRNIVVSQGDLVAGTSNLTTGRIHIVYE